MNEQDDNNFEALRTLMSLKRHEIPPPRYFNEFSGNVVARIRKGEVGNADALGKQIHAEAPWLLRLLQKLQAKPAYTGAFASGLGLLLVAGIVFSDNLGSSPADLMPPQTAETSASLAAASMTLPTVAEQSVGPAPTMSMSSTNPVLNFDSGAPAFGGGSPIFQSPAYPQ